MIHCLSEIKNKVKINIIHFFEDENIFDLFAFVEAETKNLKRVTKWRIIIYILIKVLIILAAFSSVSSSATFNCGVSKIKIN